ncbi:MULTISPECIES: cupin domain-containing protein [unclassified Knoellia]|uniref:cupin domain-containing protein n=1 Tax=Knoellia altitudinis TaxID=3404795 RepID=UPI003615B477
MTEPPENPRSETVVSTAGSPALARLVGMPPADFASRAWSRSPLLTRAAELRRDFSDLFGADAVDELVAGRGLRTPFARMARDGATLPASRLTLGGGVGAGIADQLSEDRILREFASGATLVLQALHRTWAPIQSFAAALSDDLGHPVQVNAYVTPPQNQGFSDHYDVHDVFVLQIAGEKQWRIRPPVLEAPLRDQPWEQHRAAVEKATTTEPLLEETLSPGDCLYLPRGYLHSATALGGTSIHLTIGVHAWTRRHLVDALLERVGSRLAQDVEARRSLPLTPGGNQSSEVAFGDDAEVVRSLVAKALQDVGVDELVDALRPKVRAARRAEPLRVLNQAERAGDGETTWRLRGGLAGHWEHDGEGAVHVSRVGRLKVTADERDAVTDVLDGIQDPRSLDIELTRRLALAGLLVPVDVSDA